ncbi:MAG: protein kinase [Chloroflexaceae bacterium]|nr:protein kinase [Chloroflexaceae bacterium]
MTNANNILRPGFLFNGRYLIVRQISAGVSGAVYEAIDRRTRQRVILKQRYTSSHDTANIPHFEYIAGQLQALRHMALPRVFDAFVAPVGQFIVMELIAGADLWALMDERQYKPFTMREVLPWLDQLLDALMYMHSQSVPVVHGNVKPQNIRVSGRGEIRLVDLGANDLPIHNVMLEQVDLQSLQFDPPEKLQGQVLQPQSDLYALGSTIYYLLTGLPFPNAIDRALALSLGQSDPLVRIDATNRMVPPDFAAILDRALAYIPNERFHSAAGMRQALSEREETQVLTVSREGDGDFTSIGAALVHAQPGQRIVVQPGIYRESLVIEHPVTLIGEGAPADIIIESLNAPCLVMRTEQAEVNGFTLVARSTSPTSQFLRLTLHRARCCWITARSPPTHWPALPFTATLQPPPFATVALLMAHRRVSISMIAGTARLKIASLMAMHGPVSKSVRGPIH